MPAALSIRTDRSPAELRRLAHHERDGRVSARLLALANALEGIPREEAAREEAARLAGMTGQTLGDWGHRYNAEGGEGLKDRPRSGRPPRLGEGQQAALKALILKGLRRDGWAYPPPLRFGQAPLRSRLQRQAQAAQGPGPVGLDLPWQKARPLHLKADPKAQERLKKACPA